jgi:hypothetical protein
LLDDPQLQKPLKDLSLQNELVGVAHVLETFLSKEGLDLSSLDAMKADLIVVPARIATPLDDEFRELLT